MLLKPRLQLYISLVLKDELCCSAVLTDTHLTRQIFYSTSLEHIYIYYCTGLEEIVHTLYDDVFFFVPFTSKRIPDAAVWLLQRTIELTAQGYVQREVRMSGCACTHRNFTYRKTLSQTEMGWVFFFFSSCLKAEPLEYLKAVNVL